MSKRESDASDSASTSASDRSSRGCSSGSEGPVARRKTYAAVTVHRKTKASASAQKACEDGGSQKRGATRHSRGKRVLPIIQCTGWDAKVLVDTGSTHTLVHNDAARASGWLGAVTPCNCEATTVAGITAMGGELVLDLKPISGLKRTVKAHVLDWGPQTYQVILGADALCSMGARVTTGSGGCRVKVGKQTLQFGRSVRRRGLCGGSSREIARRCESPKR
ncbi:hypothetical protein AAG570_013193 [Ranatra chinensis]|uniref:Gag-pol polyprotein n=1 Tax=Ranatra chinensis TaxID=642074 RepID=A0ABD0YG84_9HEMI